MGLPESFSLSSIAERSGRRAGIFVWGVEKVELMREKMKKRSRVVVVGVVCRMVKRRLLQ